MLCIFRSKENSSAVFKKYDIFSQNTKNNCTSDALCQNRKKTRLKKSLFRGIFIKITSLFPDIHNSAY